jgi:hypothetical protein
MCRDADILHKVVTHWLPASLAANEARGLQKVKTVIVVPDFFYPPGPAQETFQSFLSQLEEATGIQRTPKSLSDQWVKDNPSKDGKTLVEYIGKVSCFYLLHSRYRIDRGWQSNKP